MEPGIPERRRALIGLKPTAAKRSNPIKASELGFDNPTFFSYPILAITT
ncbi:MAG: hypothetical protein ACFFFG_18835 [Candidatus Thorarchaeota archaeon]